MTKQDIQCLSPASKHTHRYVHQLPLRNTPQQNKTVVISSRGQEIYILQFSSWLLFLLCFFHISGAGFKLAIQLQMTLNFRSSCPLPSKYWDQGHTAPQLASPWTLYCSFCQSVYCKTWIAAWGPETCLRNLCEVTRLCFQICFH